ncbi:phenylacetate--CoA ligase [Christiangramia fulva]|uniref:Phenylacetate--CoA ligase n=1 Tax=Christiangramia fulva TaxID=2126553 RepID=A0A2R3Z806_9FLAO|nr:AMP-binding protein [Christiangramia fulva]AVR46410.1 phenylacetate--CoA ligase [Christiangramia fulva]
MKDLYFRDKKEIEEEQFALLRKQLLYIAEHSPFYQLIFRERGVDISKIESFDDLRTIPITTKEDLQRFNEDFIAVPKAEIIDLVTTSGTLGSPVSFALNDADLDRLAENEQRSFEIAGVTSKDIVQITTTLDRRFMAGMAYFIGLRKMGAGIIRTGSGLPKLQWESIQRFQPTVLVAVPSFLLKLIDYAVKNKIDIQNSPVKKAICIGEPLRSGDGGLNALGKKITEKWEIELFSTYASTEMATAFTECEFHKGNHVLSDLIYTEIVDEQGREVAPGETGELVVTPLGVQTMPLVRFATGDMLTFTNSACECGRNTKKLGPVIGRKQQKLKLKGTSIYPQHIIEALNSYGKLESFLIEASHDELSNDKLKILIPDTLQSAEIESLKEHFKSELHVTPDFEKIPLEEINSIRFPKTSRKPQVFKDLRN